MRKRRVAILTPDLRHGDAVGMDTLRIAQLLYACGWESRIFAPTGDRGLTFDRPGRLLDFLSSSDDLLLYQYAVSYETGRDLFGRARCLRALRYHNVTPPHFFEPYSTEIAAACRIGREELAGFVSAGPDVFLPASQFNRLELELLGADPARCHVLPPFTDDAAMVSVEADLDWVGRLAFLSPPGPLVLSVGRVVPNKGHRLLIESFARFRSKYQPRARLIVAGARPPGLERYQREIETLTFDLGLEASVRFTGKVARSQLKACFLSADVLGCTSEHEGFCLPLVEAMALGLPVVALARAAVPETLGDAGLLYSDADPDWFAEAWNRLLLDARQRSALIERGLDRYRSVFREGPESGKILRLLDQAAGETALFGSGGKA